MKQLGVIFLLGLVVLACQPKLQPDKPDNLISKEQMTEILYDMFIVNSAKGVNRRKLELEGINPERYILEKYNIDSLQFAQSNDYYAYDIETYSSMVETIKKRLTKEKEHYEAIDKKEQDAKKRKRDSLKNLKNDTSLELKEPLKKRAANPVKNK